MKNIMKARGLAYSSISFFFLIISVVAPAYAWTDIDGGDHGGADWSPACGSEIAGTHTNIGTFSIPAGCTVYVKAYDGVGYGALGIFAASINIAGVLDGSGRGYPAGLPSPGAGGNGPDGDGCPNCAGGGGGGGGHGGNGGGGATCFDCAGAAAAGGGSYGDASSKTMQMGSGGGNGGKGGGAGGGGGAGIMLNASTIKISGVINVAGGGGGNGGIANSYAAGGGGGGSGGSIVIDGVNVDISNSQLRAKGGAGGSSPSSGYWGGGGGGGGGGRIKIFYHSLLSTLVTIDVSGGSGGATNGGSGSPGASGLAGSLYSADVGPPPAPVINSSHAANTWTSNNDPSFSWNAPSDPSGISGYSYAMDAVPDTIADTASVITVPYTDVSEGIHTFYVRAVDGNVNWGIPGNYTIKVDTVAPAGTITINNGAPSTTTTTVTLDLTYTDATSGVAQVRYSNDGVFDTESWESPAASRTWTLSGGDGLKTVYYQVQDAAGNTIVVSDQITLVTNVPQNATDLIVDGVSIALYGNRTYGKVEVKNGGIIYVVAYNGTEGTGYLNITATEWINITSGSQIAGSGAGYRGRATSVDVNWVVTPGNGEGPGGGASDGTNSGGSCSGLTGGGGAGHGGLGTNNPIGYGLTYGSSTSDEIRMGSGGGGGGVAGRTTGRKGGNGGAAIALKAPIIRVQGTIAANGQNGDTAGFLSYQGGGGGGAGGTIQIAGNAVDVSSAILSAIGGNGGGGDCGGGGSGGGGRVKVFYGSLNNAGTSINVGGGNPGTIYTADVAGPSAPVISSGTHASSAWTSNNDPSFTWAAPSDSSGISGYSYSLDGLPDDIMDTSGTAVSLVDVGEGMHTFYVKAKDGAGNWGGVASYVIRVDTVAPTTIDNAPAGWQGGNVAVTLTPSDAASGIASTRYCVDQSNTCTPATIGSSVTVPTEGTNDIRYYSTDNAGNNEAVKSSIIRIDKSPPATTDNAPAGWRNTSVVVSLSPSDPLSGVASTKYCIDQLNICTPATLGTSVNVTSEGDNYVRYYSTDNVGNGEAVKSAIVRIDKTPPSTTDNAPAGWQKINVTVTLAASDAYSGIASTNYCVDQSNTCTPTTLGTGVNIASDGINYVRYYSTDNSGNSEALRIAVVMIDKSPPATSDNAPTDWRNTSVTVTLSPTDAGSGVNTTRLRVDAGVWLEAVGITIGTEGNHSVEYYSVDKVGNVEAVKTAYVAIDKSPPTTTDNAPSDWQASAFNVTLNASDAYSGVNSTRYRVDAGSWQTGSSVGITTQGNHIIEYHSVDKAGNSEPVKTTYAALDLSTPLVVITSPGNTTYLVNYVELNYTVTSQGAGIDKTWLRLDGGANQSLVGNTMLTLLTDGGHAVTVCANNTLSRTGCAGVAFTINTIDLLVTIDDIVISPMPYHGDTVSINATIHDPKNMDTSVIVNIYDNEVLIHTQLLNFASWPDQYVRIQDFSYKPGNISVPHGTRVVWTNLETVTFTVTSPGAWDSGDITPGNSYGRVFNQTGVFNYSSTYQPSVKGNVNVVNRSKVVSKQWTATEGAHNITVKIDEANAVVEPDEANNIASKLIAVYRRPDLQIASSGIAMEPSNATAGDPVNITVNVSNTGGLPATAKVELRIDSVGIGNNTVFVANGSSNVTKYAWTAQPGTHILTAIADVDNQVQEDFKLNNNASRTIGINTKPDLYLAASDIAFNPAAPLHGDLATITATIYNGGDLAAASAVRLLIDDVLAGENSLFFPGNTYNTTYWSWTAVNGSHNFTVIIDPSNIVVEGSEGNNNATKTMLVLTRPDLEASGLAISPASPLSGQNTTLNVTVKNLGQASASFMLEISVDGAPLKNETIALAGEAQASRLVNWTAVNGTHQIKAVADPGNSVVEGDEANNNVSALVTAYNVEDVVGIGLADSYALAEGLRINATVSNDQVKRVYANITLLNASTAQVILASATGSYSTVYNPGGEGAYRIVIYVDVVDGRFFPLANKSVLAAQAKTTVAVTANAGSSVTVNLSSDASLQLNLTASVTGANITTLQYTNNSVLNSILGRVVNVDDVNVTDGVRNRTFKFLDTYLTITADSALNTALGRSSITLRYNQSLVDGNGIDESTLQIAYYNDSSNQWETLPTTVDAANNAAAYSIEHFGTYALVGYTPWIGGSTGTGSGGAGAAGGGGGGGGEANRIERVFMAKAAGVPVLLDFDGGSKYGRVDLEITMDSMMGGKLTAVLQSAYLPKLEGQVRTVELQIPKATEKEFQAHLASAKLKIRYSEEELQAQGYTEDGLRLFYLDPAASTWIDIKDNMASDEKLSHIKATGLDTAGNYAWIELTHISAYALAYVKLLPPPPTPEPTPPPISSPAAEATAPPATLAPTPTEATSPSTPPPIEITEEPEEEKMPTMEMTPQATPPERAAPGLKTSETGLDAKALAMTAVPIGAVAIATTGTIFYLRRKRRGGDAKAKPAAVQQRIPMAEIVKAAFEKYPAAPESDGAEAKPKTGTTVEVDARERRPRSPEETFAELLGKYEEAPTTKTISHLVGEAALVKARASRAEEAAAALAVEHLRAGRCVFLVSSPPRTDSLAKRLGGYIAEGRARVISLTATGSYSELSEVPMTNLEYFIAVYEEIPTDGALIFESLTSLILNAGSAAAIRFVSDTLAYFSRKKISLAFIMNPEAHEAALVSSFESLFASHIEL